ncbi:hypothetical protein [Leptospira noguchii]|uniref:hypothetical protein n=1 Tax=Leptospira noguchii TaxID=28182 RepID=UPI0003284FAF|nr:hypothetical protein [Leptospira noguchii]EMS83792.1 hypothetical protein LEP1GSC074_2026 [Leptospira noguchii str. Hook]
MSSVIDIKERQNINKPGKYYLSNISPSRLERLPDSGEGTFQIVGELKDDGNFSIAKESFTRQR